MQMHPTSGCVLSDTVHTDYVNASASNKLDNKILLSSGERRIVWWKQVFVVSELQNHRVVRTPCNRLAIPGRTPTTWRMAKIITVLTSRNRSPNTSAHCVLVLKSPRKTQHSQALDGTRLYFRNKRQSKISSNNGHPLWLGGWVGLSL